MTPEPCLNLGSCKFFFSQKPRKLISTACSTGASSCSISIVMEENDYSLILLSRRRWWSEKFSSGSMEPVLPYDPHVVCSLSAVGLFPWISFLCGFLSLFFSRRKSVICATCCFEIHHLLCLFGLQLERDGMIFLYVLLGKSLFFFFFPNIFYLNLKY